MKLVSKAGDRLEELVKFRMKVEKQVPLCK